MSETSDVLEVPALAVSAPKDWQALPEPLLVKMTDEEMRKWIVKELDLIQKKQDWLINQICELGKVTVAHHKQIVTWKRRVENPMIAVIGILVWFGPLWIPKVLSVFGNAATNGVRP